MEIRKKEIQDLEEKNRRAAVSIENQLEILGKNLLSRSSDTIQDRSLPAQSEEFATLLGEIEGIKGQISGVEEDNARLAEIEDDIRQKETDNTELATAKSNLRIQLGEVLLTDPAFEDFAQFYQDSLSTLLPKLRSLEDRLELMEEQSGVNLFRRMSNNAQSVLLKSQLAKNRNDLQRLYAKAGERYLLARADSVAPTGKAGELLQKMDDFTGMEEEIAAHLAAQKELRGTILDSFKPEGSGNRKIQSLQRRIAEIEERLRKLYMEYGKQAEASVREDPELRTEEQGILSALEELREAIQDATAHIAQLSASLAIDEERAKIDRMEKQIRENKERISAAESLINELTASIEECKSRIEDLSEVMHGGKAD